jgi:acyl-CoA hydrolase
VTKKRLGIRSEFFTEEMADLAECAVVTNTSKNIDANKSSTCFAIGTRQGQNASQRKKVPRHFSLSSATYLHAEDFIVSY